MKFIIKIGHHFASGFRFRPYLGKRIISWKVNMDISCLYNPINDDSGDLNKLCGISFGHHHQNSLRFAWRPDFNEPGQIMIYAYWYTRGHRRSLYICNVSHNIDYDFTIVFSNSRVGFTVSVPGAIFKENRRTVIVAYSLPCPRIGYYLWPYFGGNNTAPHGMRIDLENL